MEEKKKNEKWFINQLLDVLRHKKLPLDINERMVLIAIANSANQKGVCSLFLDEIASFAGRDKTNIPRYIKSLKTKKIITVKKQFKRGTKRMTKSQYSINIKAIIDLSIDNNGDPIISGSRQCDVTIEPISDQKVQSGHVNMTIGSRQYDGVKLISKLKANTSLKENILDIVQPRLDVNSGTELIPFTFDLRFEEFWQVFPRHEKRKEALRIWRRDKLDKVADQIIEDVRQRRLKHDRWQNITYIPLPTTYLNQEMWTDEIIEGAKHEETRGNIRVQRESRRVEAIRKGFDEYDAAMQRIREAEGLS